MKIKTNIPVKSTYHNKPIVTDVFYIQNNIKKPLVIFCHGYKGYKDWGAWNLAAESLAEKNLFFLKFNFSHNGGTLQNPIDFPDLDAFGENNFTIELNDLEDVINWIRNNETYKEELDINNITLIGHSRGGGIVAIKGFENQHISKVITWNGVSDYSNRFPKGEPLSVWENTGVMHVLNGRTKQQMPHKYQFYKDFFANKDRLNIKNVVENLSEKLLIINGDRDSVVLPIEGKEMHLWNPKSKWIVIDEMDHTLGSKHPWNKEVLPIYLEKAIQFSVDFIK